MQKKTYLIKQSNPFRLLTSNPSCPHPRSSHRHSRFHCLLRTDSKKPPRSQKKFTFYFFYDHIAFWITQMSNNWPVKRTTYTNKCQSPTCNANTTFNSSVTVLHCDFVLALKLSLSRSETRYLLKQISVKQI